MEPTDWLTTEGPFKRYLLSCGRSANTARTYASGVKMFWRWCAKYEMTPFEATRAELRDWTAERHASVSGTRLHNDLAGLRCFYAWLRETGYRDDNPTEGVKIKRGKRLPTKPLSMEELDALMQAASCERDRLLILVLAHTGLRVSELASLTSEDIDWASGVIIITGKGDKQRKLAPQIEVINRLHAFCGMFPSGPVWMSKWDRPLAEHQIRKLIYAVAAKAHVENVHPHRFRAFFATTYIEQFADIQALQGVMGHESIETTSKYSEWTREARGLKQMRALKILAS